MHSTNLVLALLLNMIVMNIFHQCMDNNGEPEQQCQVTVCKEYHHFHFPFKKLMSRFKEILFTNYNLD